MNSSNSVRNIQVKSFLGLIAMALLLSACATAWKPAPPTLKTARWSVTAPSEWMYFSTSAYEMLSKDGPYLQYILIQERPLAREFKHTRQKLEAAMLPDEAAQVIVNNMSADPQIKNFQLLRTEPAMIGGHMGFKLEYTYLDQQNVPIKSIYYGVILPRLFFNLRYTAAHRFYFSKDLDTFDQVCQSVRLPDRKKSSSRPAF